LNLFIGKCNDIVRFGQGSGGQCLPFFSQFLFECVGDLLQCIVSLIKGERFDLYEDLDGLFMLALIDMVLFDTERSEELFDKMVETQVLFTSVFEYKIVGESFFVQKRAAMVYCLLRCWLSRRGVRGASMRSNLA